MIWTAAGLLEKEIPYEESAIAENPSDFVKKNQPKTIYIVNREKEKLLELYQGLNKEHGIFVSGNFFTY